jgi:hypothetical protein
MPSQGLQTFLGQICQHYILARMYNITHHCKTTAALLDTCKNDNNAIPNVAATQ